MIASPFWIMLLLSFAHVENDEDLAAEATAIAATVRVKLLAIDRMRNPPGHRPSITGRW
jgi:hypothetical protein